MTERQRWSVPWLRDIPTLLFSFTKSFEVYFLVSAQSALCSTLNWRKCSQRWLAFNVEIITVVNVIIKINKLSICHVLLMTLSGHCHIFIQDSTSQCQEAGKAPRIQAWGLDFGSQNSPERWAGTKACWESHLPEGGDIGSPCSKPQIQEGDSA